jgi:hypothetical protein
VLAQRFQYAGHGFHMVGALLHVDHNVIEVSGNILPYLAKNYILDEVLEVTWCPYGSKRHCQRCKLAQPADEGQFSLFPFCYAEISICIAEIRLGEYVGVKL